MTTPAQTMLELADECDFYAKAVGSNPKNTLLKAAKALRAPGGSEPVAWLCIWLDGGKSFTFDRPYPFAGQVIPLYASPLPGRAHHGHGEQVEQARKNKHSQIMTAFYWFLESCGSDRPIEGEQRYSDMLAAFRVGFSAARTDMGSGKK